MSFDIKQLVLFTWIDTNYSTQHPTPKTQYPKPHLLPFYYEYGEGFAFVGK